VLGWVAISPTSSRPCYSGVAELSIYISESSRGSGLGAALLMEAVKQSEENGIWTLHSGIIRDNTKSISLHKKCGFREIGVREKVAKMPNGKWHDVMLMERRSKVIGTS
jgi:phosphinothricin acetyltransferase